jgi:Fe2+ or Zn2+ uptake regulation protein/O6-methylguanine-DNA--protein-cysteine methyltransferase
MNRTESDAGELLRARGMRSTPQRRAMLGVFEGGRAEHLSAEEVFVRAARSLPDLSRGTVYATLAEFTEAGLLAAFGTPEPVRYETNTEHHAHFRCRLCLRIFDVAIEGRPPEPIRPRGFRVERIDIRADGVCDECSTYERGLKSGVREIARAEVAPEASAGWAAASVDSPVGQLLLLATPAGVARLAFDEHADAPRLRALSSRRGGARARTHLRDVAARLERYFAGEPFEAPWPIDWSAIDSRLLVALHATLEIPYGKHRSYCELGADQSPRELGWTFGANPIPIITPCHRVSRGTELPSIYVGGIARRRWLEEHERRHAASLERPEHKRV